MKLLGASPAAQWIVLVDSTRYANLVPIPSIRGAHVLSSYHIENGVTHRTAHGGDPGEYTVPCRIRQVDDVTAQALLKTLRAAILDEANQPFTVIMDDTHNVITGPWDGIYYVALVDAPQASTEIRGRIDLTLTIAEARDDPPYQVGGPPIIVMHNGGGIGTVTGSAVEKA